MPKFMPSKGPGTKSLRNLMLGFDTSNNLRFIHLPPYRVDPIMSPGSSPANHVHTVHGASKFSAGSTYDTLRTSSCTSCLISQDLSTYCKHHPRMAKLTFIVTLLCREDFPKLYFRDPQTLKYEAVPNGNLLVYYLNRGSADVANGGSGLKAFPPGLVMMSGNPNRRTKKYPYVSGVGFAGTQEELKERAIEWTCLRYINSTASGYDSTTSIGAKGFPSTNCEVGVNLRIHMPACWDGVNLDSPDHMSHVAYLSQLDNGDCPSTHPVTFMKMSYEITWDIQKLENRWDYTKDEWPFVFSNGDPTGYSSHAFFQNGWDAQVLQNAIDRCNNPDDDTGHGDPKACQFFTVKSPDDAMACKIEPSVKDSFEGVLDKLPGCNPLQVGPDDATVYSDSSCPAFSANGSVAPNTPPGGGGTGSAGISAPSVNVAFFMASLLMACSALLSF
ncbi:hypothetical protein CVT24_009245 [Panaeolus cyanescens]|uniref:DUF1996 domain-containing protein n=1 Tax=Panaeolus cyanescens TaxID=181874 RepID=A0A409Y835_9AGAR|nr:hypothetical protein CVT24_009245 [Panaeolus cyanescens]